MRRPPVHRSSVSWWFEKHCTALAQTSLRLHCHKIKTRTIASSLEIQYLKNTKSWVGVNPRTFRCNVCWLLQIYTRYNAQDRTLRNHSWDNFRLLLLLLLFNSTANWILFGGSDTALRHNTQKYTYHTNQHTTLKQNTAHKATQKKISMVWVRERTIPTERPTLVGEVIANFCG
jgi:hypothetical protein